MPGVLVEMGPHYGSTGAFQRDLSARSVHGGHVRCLYCCENWVVTKELYAALEKFQGELVKRILKMSWIFV